jgi:hypothetical protein
MLASWSEKPARPKNIEGPGRNGTLMIVDDVTGEPQAVQLSGRGAPPKQKK